MCGPGARRLLYMAAVAATRHNSDLGRKYGDLIGRGKLPKVALVAVMRKLLLLANALLRQNRIWTREPATSRPQLRPPRRPRKPAQPPACAVSAGSQPQLGTRDPLLAPAWHSEETRAMANLHRYMHVQR